MINKIEKKIKEKINVISLSINNESYLHNNKNKQQHYKIVIISNQFNNITLIERHRTIYKILNNEFNKSIFSLNLYTFTLIEWKKKNSKIFSIPCLNI
ncbi:DNA-binding transcriptional regulator BolA [Buchnera aphidicola (Thelaxes suberi)]|uniref:BolA family protein n=1 Tax=Buchnera aphidicola TaxID=9 RepID=UPI0034642811